MGKSENNHEGKKQQIGICLLRILMSLCVVLSHYWLEGHEGYVAVPGLDLLHHFTGYAVPVFMILSFLLGRKLYESGLERNWKGLAVRLRRLLVPYVGWTILTWLLYKLGGRIWHHDYSLGLKALLVQLLFGHHYNTPMWFQWDLIVWTVLVFFVFALVRDSKKGVTVIAGMGVVALILEYTGVNYKLFGGLPRQMSFPMGRLVEVFPFITIGVLLWSNDFLERTAKLEKRKKWIPILVSFMLILNFGIARLIPDPAQNFALAGIRQIVVAVAMVILFLLLPLQNLSERTGKIISFLSSYSMGVYFSHKLVGDLLELATGHAMVNFWDALLIYLISFVISFLIDRIPFRIAKELVM